MLVTDGLRSLARLLGVREDQAHDALHSERAAQAVLRRRDFFAASGALAAGVAFVETPALAPVPTWRVPSDLYAGWEMYKLAAAAILPMMMYKIGESP